MPNWERRFRAPLTFLPSWSPAAPDLVVYASNESGIWQLHARDLATDAHRRVTDHPVGVLDGTTTLDGEGILWFQDETGDESGQWLVQPFHGGETRPFLDGVPHGWTDGLAQAPGIVVAAISDRDGFAVYVSLDGARARVVHRSSESVQLGSAESGGFLRGALSADGSLLCLQHAEHGDLIHPALRVIDPRTGATVGEQLDEGMSLAAKCWSPAPGDQRLAIEHERDGDERPGALGRSPPASATTCLLDLEGGVFVEDWWPDASALLLKHRFEGRDQLYRYDLASGSLDALDNEPGFVWSARVRPDGHVWFLHEQGHRQRLVLDDVAAEPITVEGERAPSSRPYESWHFENPHGQRVHGFYVTPGRLRWPVPGDDVRPRRADVARLRPLAARGTGLRGRGLRRGDGQLPRLDRLRARVARHARRKHRRAGARGRERRAAGSRRARPGRPRACGDRRLLLGRVRHAPRAGQASRPLAVRDRRRARRRLRGRVRGALTPPPGVRPRAPRRARAEGPPGAHARPQCDQLRGRRARARDVPDRAERQPLPLPTGDAVRGEAGCPEPPARGLRLRDRPRLLRRRRARASGVDEPRLSRPARPRPGWDPT